MNKYNYKAVSQNGKYQTGTISATNVSELISILRSTNLELISYRLKKTQSNFLDQIKLQDLITIFIHLEQLNKAGVALVDSISDLRDSSNNSKIRNLMHEIYESIRDGSLFSESLAKHPDIFDQVYVGLVQNGEKTGNLAEAFNSIVDHLKWTIEIKRKTRKATTSPLFGLFVMSIVMGIMTTVVVPKVTGFLQAQSIALPMMTTSLIAFSDFVRNRWYLIVFSVPAIFFFVKFLRRMPGMAVKLDHLKLKLPVFGQILTKLDAARFCHFFSITFRSGLGVIECLESAATVINNAAMKESILIIKQQVSEGKSLAEAISSSGYFPNLVVRMFKIGEESGNMESSLQNIKFFYDREINDSIDRLVGMIQPTLTIIMGGMMAWITIAVFGPIYGTFSQFN